MATKYRKSDIILPKTGMQMIQDERQRQIDRGYTAEYDQRWQKHELRQAAKCYLDAWRRRLYKQLGPSRQWPWHEEKWKPVPEDRDQEIIKAAALNLAEIDRRAFIGQDAIVARKLVNQLAAKLDRSLKDDMIRFEKQKNFEKWCLPRSKRNDGV